MAHIMAEFLKTFILDSDRVIVKKLYRKLNAKYIFLRHGYDPIYSNKDKWSIKLLKEAFDGRKRFI